MNILAKAPGAIAKGLRSLSTHADNVKPGEILRSCAQRLEAVSPESYNTRLKELRALEAQVAQLASGVVTQPTPPTPTVPPVAPAATEATG